MSSLHTVLCFGEILWDLTPKGLFLGGAPTNVAYHLHKLGLRSLPVTAVGNDYLGEEIIRRVAAWGVETALIGLISEKRTGVVSVDLTDAGNPSYEIADDVAWDFVPATVDLFSESKNADAIVFGSLALRHKPNRLLLDKLLAASGSLKVFDVNLRPPYFDIAQVLELARRADLVKLNIDELEILHPFAVGSLEVMAATFSDLIGGKQVCVTCGADGASYWDGHRWAKEDGRPITVSGDAVGAGDAFLAGLISGLTARIPIEIALNRACRLAEIVAATDGAQPYYDASSFKAF
jgi:fructokinase